MPSVYDADSDSLTLLDPSYLEVCRFGREVLQQLSATQFVAPPLFLLLGSGDDLPRGWVNLRRTRIYFFLLLFLLFSFQQRFSHDLAYKWIIKTINIHSQLIYAPIAVAIGSFLILKHNIVSFKKE